MRPIEVLSAQSATCRTDYLLRAAPRVLTQQAGSTLLSTDILLKPVVACLPLGIEQNLSGKMQPRMLTCAVLGSIADGLRKHRRPTALDQMSSCQFVVVDYCLRC